MIFSYVQFSHILEPNCNTFCSFVTQSCDARFPNEMLPSNAMDRNSNFRFVFQMAVDIADNGVPVKTTQASVRINVVGNRVSPTIENLPLTMILQENHVVNSGVLNVTGRDTDLKGALVYMLVGDFPGTNYFRIEPSKGMITLVNPIRVAPDQTYKVSAALVDKLSGRPLRCAGP